ncbi:putative ribonuclease H-like domain-containing protein, partial [Tanacetum coccineum]
IDYDKVFAPVARIEAIRLFLAYASFMGFIVYQMDVKSAFLYGTIEEEVYVCQPPGFEDPQFPDKVYKVEKALYGLHQAPRAWYETLSTYLLENRFRRGTIDKTLFIKKDKGDILLMQVYVDDIIFGSTKKYLCVEFEQMMHKRFQMSSMGELTFFLGLQVTQKDDEIFINQDKYMVDILKKFNFVTVKTTSTPIETNKALLKNEEAEDVDVHLYRLMIGSLMYLIASRPDIMFVVCACARFQVTPKVSHLHEVKRIFRYLKASLDMKSTTAGCQFLGKRLISWQCKKQIIVANSTTEAEYVAAANCCGQQFWATAKSKIVNNEMQIHAKVDGKTIVISESSVRSNLHINDEDGVTSLTNSKILENLALMGYEIVSDKLTFQKAFFSPQWKYLIHTILHCLSSKSTAWNKFSTNIASAVICLANNQKFNFSKLIFDEPFNDTYETPKQTQKVFANMRRKGKGFSGTVTPLFASMLVPQVVEGEGSGQPSEPQPPPSIVPPSQEGQSSGPPEKVSDEAVHKELGDRVERAATTAASLDAAQDSGNILKTQSTAIPNVPLFQEIGTCGSLRCQKAMGVPLLRLGGHTPGSDEGRLQQENLMDIVTALSQKVEGLESDLKKTKKLRRLTFVTSEDEDDLVAEDPSKQGRSLIEEMDLDAGISLVHPHVEVQGSTVNPQKNADTIADDLTLAETLMEIRKSAGKDKGKAKMDKTESPRKMKQRERVQISRDKEVAQKLQEEFDAAERQKLAQVHQAGRLYDTCGVHHVSSVRGHDIFMLVEKEYPLTRGTLGLMMVARLLVEADSEMSRELLRKIFYQANKPRQ